MVRGNSGRERCVREGVHPWGGIFEIFFFLFANDAVAPLVPLKEKERRLGLWVTRVNP